MATPTEPLAERERLLGRLLEQLDGELPEAIELRHRLHRNPELAHAEHATLEMVAERLPVPCRTRRRDGRRGPHRARQTRAPVAVRAELDGLPLRELTGSEFSADGRDDARLRARRPHGGARGARPRRPRARRRAPGAAAGAAAAERGGLPLGRRAARAAASSPRSHPRAVVGAHVHPELPWGTVGLDEGVVNASCDAAEITIHGKPYARGLSPPRPGPDPGAGRGGGLAPRPGGTADRPARRGRPDGGDDRGRQRRERDPGAGPRARRAAGPQPRAPARSCASWCAR